LPITAKNSQGVWWVVAVGRSGLARPLMCCAVGRIVEHVLEKKQGRGRQGPTRRMGGLGTQAALSSQASTHAEVVYFRLRCWMVFRAPDAAAS